MQTTIDRPPTTTRTGPMQRTANQLRPGDLAALFPGQLLLVISAHPHPTDAGCTRILAVTSIEGERVITRQEIPNDTWYVIHRRGLLGRLDDRLRAQS